MKRFFIIIGISIVSQVAMAQWRITATISSSGNCKNIGGGVHNAIAKAMVDDANSLQFDNEDLCRRYCNNLIREYSTTHDGCTTRVVATCHGLGGGSNGGINVLGVSQGTSFYSTNGSNEIQNWSEDEATRRMGLDKNYNSDESTNISTGDPDYDNARNGIDPNKLFVSVNMRDEQRNIVQPNEYYFGEVLGSNDKRWSDIIEKESTNELYTDYTISENEKYDEIDFYADLAEDVLHSALDIAEVTGAVVGATTVAGTIAAAVLADLAVSLVIEDGVAVYKWVANDESVSTMDIFKNTLDRASFGATAFTKTGLEEALVKDGWLMNNNKLFFGKAVSIALRTVHYGNKLYDKVKENE